MTDSIYPAASSSPSKNIWPWVLAVLIAAQFSLTLTYNLTHFYELKKSALDGLLYTQLLHNFLNGDGLTTTLHRPYSLQHWFGIHFSPILYLLAPLYAVFPALETLQAVHCLALALAAWPIYLFARRLNIDASHGVLISGFYLFSPFVINAAIWDFHEIAFAPLVMVFAAIALLDGDRRRFLLCMALLICIKEHYGLSVFGFGILWGWHRSDWRFGAAVAAGGIAALLLVLFVIMPHFSPHGAAMMLAKGSGNDRYSWLADPLANLDIIYILFVSGIFYIFQLLIPLGFLPAFIFIWLFPTAADLAVNLLSTNEMMRNPYSYHSATIYAFFIVAYMVALTRNSKKKARFKRTDILFVTSLFTAFLFFVAVGLPLNKETNVWNFGAPKFDRPHPDQQALEKIHALMDKTSPIAGQNNVLPQLAPRKEVHQFPYSIQNSRYIILHTGFPYALTKDMFGSPYDSNDGLEYFNALGNLWNDPHWGVVFYEHGWLVFERGKKTDAALAAQAKRDSQATEKFVGTLR